MSDKIRMLREHGFQFVRLVRHGEMWVNGPHVMLVPRKSASDDPRAHKNWLSLLKKKSLEITKPPCS